MALVALLGRSPVLGQGDLGQRIAQRWGQRTGRVLGGPLSPLGSLPDRCPRGPDWQPPVRFSPGLPHPDYRRGAASGRMDGLWGAAAFARACEVFALAVGFGFFLIFLFGVFRLQWDEVLLWNWQELSQVTRGCSPREGQWRPAAMCSSCWAMSGRKRRAEGRSCAVWEDCSCFWGRECSCAGTAGRGPGGPDQPSFFPNGLRTGI